MTTQFDIKKFILIIFIQFSVLKSFGQLFGVEYFPCKIIYNNDSIKNGFVAIPNMLDTYIKFKKEVGSSKIEIDNGDLKEIRFTIENKLTVYQTIRTYRNYGNKKINSCKSWLRVIKIGEMNLFCGTQTNFNTPSANLYYCKKSEDSVAFFISLKYSGFMVMTIGASNTFRKNAGKYFVDCKELVDKIEEKIYNLENIELVVDEYNMWWETRKKN